MGTYNPDIPHQAARSSLLTLALEPELDQARLENTVG